MTLKKTLELILHGKKISINQSVLDRCFHLALRKDDVESMNMLWDRGANPNGFAIEGDFGGVLHECAYHGNLLMAKAVLEHPLSRIDVNDTGGRYYSAVIAAVCRTDPDTTSLTEKGRIKAADKMNRRRQRMLEYLIKKKHADYNLSGGMYGNLLNATAMEASPTVLSYILDKIGVSIDSTDHEGRSPAHAACVSKSPYTVERLDTISKRPSKEPMLLKTDKQGRQPIHFASGSPNQAAVSYLLKYDPELINVADDDGWTPLHWACRQWDTEMIHLLIRKDADITARTKDKWTPWHVACFSGNNELGDLLDKDSFKDEEGLPQEEGTLTGAFCDSCYCVSPSHPDVEVY